MSLTIIDNPACRQHDMGDMHPECPARLLAIHDELIASGLDYVVQRQSATQATREQLYLAHTKDYVDDIFAKAPTSGEIWLDDDTQMMPATLDAALYAAGSAVNGIDLLMRAPNQQVFCAVRPPGHHAEKDKAMGFCLFNNVAIAALYAIAEYGLQRVVIVDFDVHHGNGTEDIVADHPNIQFYSSFQHPFYPHSDKHGKALNINNVPLKAGTQSALYREEIQHWFSMIDRYAPELVLVSAGFDAHQQDPLAHLNLLEEDYYWLSQQLKQIANKHCQGRILSTLEGGYELTALSKSVAAHLKGLME